MRLRERYQTYGSGRCSEVELLALALGTGVRGRSGVDIARDLWDRFGSVEALRRTEVAQLAEVCGVGPARAIRVLAALQLGGRCGPGRDPDPIVDPAAAARWLAPALKGLEDEELHGLFVDRRHRVMALRRLTCGGPEHTLVDPRQILRTALRVGAHGVVLAHNHPSGDAEPSAQDREATRRVARAGAQVGVHLLDHLVFGRDCYVSFAERGELPEWGRSPAMVVG